MNIRDNKRRIAIRGIAVISMCLPISVVATSTANAVPNPIAVSMNATPSPVASGSSLTYTIVTTNSEPQQTNVRLTDQLTGLANVVLASSRGYCTLSSDLVTCEAGSMPGAGETWTVQITGLVTANNGTYLTNTATVTSDWSAQNTSQTYAVPATSSVLVSNGPLGGLPDLSVNLIGPTTATANSPATFQLTVNNSGGSNAQDIFLQVTLPPGFGVGTVAGTSLFGCDATDNPVIRCVGGAVNAGANATITIPVTVNNTTPSGSALSYKTTAVVDPENAIVESNELNNTAQQTLTVPAAPPPTEPLTFSKTAKTTGAIVNNAPAFSDPTGQQARPGDTLTYTLVVTNTSTKWTATRLQVTDGTQGLDQASVTAKSSDAKLLCVNSNSQVKCAASNNNWTLNTNTAVTITVSGRVVQPPSSIITNTATAQTLQNKVSITRTSSVTTIVRPGIDLTVTNYATCVVTQNPAQWNALLSAPPGGCPPFRARNQFEYLVTVGNSGLNDANGTAVRIPLPNDVIYEGYDDLGSGFTCAPNPNASGIPNNVVVCTGNVLGQLAGGSYPGTTKQFRLHLTAPNSVGPITAITTVDPYNALPESDETNNTFSTTTQIATGVDFKIEQAVRCPRDSRADPLMCDAAAPSGTLLYDIVVTNQGTQDASGIKVTDILPNGVRFRSAKEIPPVFDPVGAHAPYTPAHNLSCTSDGAALVTCTGGRLLGSYAAYLGPLLHLSGSLDTFTIEVKAFAPAPFGPNDSVNATGSPILNQVAVDPDNTIPEFVESNANPTNNLNLLETNVGIPPEPGHFGDWGTYNELTVTNNQTDPVDSSTAPPTPLPVAPNGTLQYTLTVRNYGSDPVTNVVVKDTIPQGARFRDVVSDPLLGGTGGFVCSFSSPTITCANGALAASTGLTAPFTPAETTIHVLLFAPDTVSGATTKYTNHAVIDPANTIAEADETNNVSDAALTVSLQKTNGSGVNSYNELTLDNKQTSPVDGNGVAVNVAPNGTLDYTLTIKNRGTDPAQNVTVYDYVPAGSRFRNVTADALSSGNGGFVCSFNAGLVTCTGGSLAGTPDYTTPTSTKIVIRLYAPDTANDVTTQYTNHAIVDPNNAIPEGDETNNVADASLTVQNAPDGKAAYNELTVTNEVSFPTSSDPVAPSGTLVYHLTVNNGGSDVATNITVRDYLPAGTIFRKARLLTPAPTGTSGFVCVNNSGVVDCNNGTLQGGGGMAVIEIVLFAPTQPQLITNQAVVDPNNVIPEGNESNNTSVVDQSMALAPTGKGSYWDLSVTLGGDNSVSASANFKQTITVKNTGTDDLFNAVVSDTIPAETKFVSAVDSAPGSGAFTCTFDNGVITCAGGTVQGTVNGGATRQIDVVLTSPTESDVNLVDNKIEIINQAMADPGNAVPEADETNNSAAFTITVNSLVDLTAANDGSDCNGKSANQCNWTFSVTNGGPDNASDVTVRTDLPVGVLPLDVVAPADWACQITENPINQVTCQRLKDMGSGATDTFTIRVYVTANSGDSISSTTIVDPNDTIVETDESNNTAMSATTG